MTLQRMRDIRREALQPLYRDRRVAGCGGVAINNTPPLEERPYYKIVMRKIARRRKQT